MKYLLFTLAILLLPLLVKAQVYLDNTTFSFSGNNSNGFATTSFTFGVGNHPQRALGVYAAFKSGNFGADVASSTANGADMVLVTSTNNGAGTKTYAFRFLNPVIGSNTIFFRMNGTNTGTWSTVGISLWNVDQFNPINDSNTTTTGAAIPVGVAGKQILVTDFRAFLVSGNNGSADVGAQNVFQQIIGKQSANSQQNGYVSSYVPYAVGKFPMGYNTVSGNVSGGWQGMALAWNPASTATFSLRGSLGSMVFRSTGATLIQAR